MTRSPEASVNAPTASGLKLTSQELYWCISFGDSTAQKQLGYKKCQRPQPSPSLSLKAIQMPYPPPKL